MINFKEIESRSNEENMQRANELLREVVLIFGAVGSEFTGFLVKDPDSGNVVMAMAIAAGGPELEQVKFIIESRELRSDSKTKKSLYKGKLNSDLPEDGLKKIEGEGVGDEMANFISKKEYVC